MCITSGHYRAQQAFRQADVENDEYTLHPIQEMYRRAYGECMIVVPLGYGHRSGSKRMLHCCVAVAAQQCEPIGENAESLLIDKIFFSNDLFPQN
jgi:hypothetical protein